MCVCRGPGEVRILDADGVFQSAWPVEVKPESIGMSPDGTVLVAGNGKIFRFSATGELLQQVESPHAVALRDNRGKLREQAVQNLSRSVNSVESRITAYRQIIESLKKKQEDKAELSDQERRLLELLPQQLTQLEKQLAEQGDVQKPRVSEEAVEQQVTSLANYKRRMASIAADKDFVYVATPALVGYGFEVWRMKHDFTEAKVVVTGLSGCCGQMDVQVSASGLYVAENARHRVARYQPDGSLLATWGKADRSGLEGFTSCCNPMNVCFNRQGDVYTAESNTGRIKRFTATGEFVEFVGDIKLVPGCKNVSIAVSADGSRIYMLDITRNHIVLMQRKSATPETEKAAAESAPAKLPATPRAASRPVRGV